MQCLITSGVYMRTIEEILGGRKLNAEEYRVLSDFWAEIRTIRARRDPEPSKNRYLVGLALSYRRITQKEIDLETLASVTGLGRSSLQKTLQKMVTKEQVVLERDENDLRRTLVKPTQEYTDLSIDMYEETRDLILEVAQQLQKAKG